jgi:hypothetical protein
LKSRQKYVRDRLGRFASTGSGGGSGADIRQMAARQRTRPAKVNAEPESEPAHPRVYTGTPEAVRLREHAAAELDFDTMPYAKRSLITGGKGESYRVSGIADALGLADHAHTTVTVVNDTLPSVQTYGGTSHAKRGIEAAQRLVHPDLDRGGGLRLEIDPLNMAIDEDMEGGDPSARAGFSKSQGNRMWVQPWSGSQTGAHEYGHYLEDNNPALRAKAQDFHAKRTVGDDVIALSSTGEGFADHEITKPDRFIKPYLGRIYSDGATELYSVGIEELLMNPGKLAKADPEYFEWLIDTLAGRN